MEDRKIPGYLRVHKFWQTPAHMLVWQVSLPYKDENLPKKFYCVVTAGGQKPGVYFSTKKPDDTQATGAFCNLYRKHVGTGSLSGLTRHQDPKSLWLTINTKGAPWSVVCFLSRPPELALVSPEGEVFVRTGPKGTFTKKRSLEPERTPASDGEDGWASTLEPWIDSELEKSDEEDESPDEGSDLEVSPYQRRLIQKLNRRLKTLKKSFAKEQARLPTPADVEQTKEKATMLQSFAHLIQPDMFELKIEPEISGAGQQITIELDPEKSAGQNIEEWFTKAKKVRKSREKSLPLIQKLENEINSITETIARLKKESFELAWIEDMYDRFGLKKESLHATAPTPKESTAKPYKVFAGSISPYLIQVGKGPKENDVLTKGASANSYWLHTVGVPGSHVVIPPVKNQSEGLPEAIKKEGAILAIHYSKLRGDQAGEVYFTQRHRIKKQKGMPPGLWNVEHSQSFFVRYSEEELKSVLERMQS